MESTCEDIRNEFIDACGEVADRYGMARIAGLVEGIMLMAREPLSLDDMAERLEVAKSSVSTNIQLLERLRIVRRVFNRGERKNYYTLRGDIWEIETEVITNVIKDELSRFGDQVARWKSGLAEAAGEDAEDKEFLSKRLADFEEYIDAYMHILNLVTSRGKVTPTVIKKIQIS